MTVKDGVITDTANPAKSVTYAELAKGKKIERFLDVKPSVEDYTKFTFVGKSYKPAGCKAESYRRSKIYRRPEIARDGFCQDSQTSVAWCKTDNC